MEREIIVCPSVQDVSRRAAEMMAERIRAAIAERGRCTLALSGGSTVRSIYEQLAAAAGIDWRSVFLFWGDDRFVEPTNPYSNYALVEEALIRRLPALRVGNVFAVPVDATNPTQGARLYEQTIRGFFGIGDDEWPRFDLCLNGMGPDGHTASLFPHSSPVSEWKRIARMNHAGQPPWVDRVTLTFPVFNAARCILVVAAGRAKAPMLKTVLEGSQNVKHWPATALHPTDGELIWILDREIASLLST